MGLQFAPAARMADHYPAVRRRPRRPEPSTPGNTRSLQTFGSPILLIVTDDPAFPSLQMSEETAIWLWRPVADKECSFCGDPESAETYARFQSHRNVSCVVALTDPERCTRVAKVIARALPAAALIAHCNSPTSTSTGPFTRDIDARAALGAGLEGELVRLDALKRVRALREFASGVEILPILVHPDPDPDALASAFAVRQLLRRSVPDTPIVTLDIITRPENRRMAELLDIQVTQVTNEELRHFSHVVTIDMQPREFAGASVKLAVIDHHPVELSYEASYVDIRPRYGATATIVTEYLRADDDRRINERLAAALTYAIKTDTEALSRGVSPADVEAYTFLLERADAPLLRLMERPAYRENTARAYGRALAGLQVQGDLAVAFLGKLSVDESHILADVADFCLAIEEATWGAAAALVGDRLVITLRSLGGDPGAGALARRLAGARGTGGGHGTMARAVVRLDEEWGDLEDAPQEKAQTILLERVSAALDALR
jgi:nanoRNase/pAp phosphatase (c-di-AMP/oligoRNAs hydrolase)